jgi:hypothetical protein
MGPGRGIGGLAYPCYAPAMCQTYQLCASYVPAGMGPSGRCFVFLPPRDPLGDPPRGPLGAPLRNPWSVPWGVPWGVAWGVSLGCPPGVSP